MVLISGGEGPGARGCILTRGRAERAVGDYDSAFRSYEKSFRPLIARTHRAAGGFASSFGPKASSAIFVRKSRSAPDGDLSACQTFHGRRIVSPAQPAGLLSTCRFDIQNRNVEISRIDDALLLPLQPHAIAARSREIDVEAHFRAAVRNEWMRMD